MATTNISSDISTNVNITARKKDSFYWVATLTHEDDTVFDLTNFTSCELKITNSNNTLVKQFVKGGSSSADTDTKKYGKIVTDVTLGTITINVPASTSLQDGTIYTNMNLLVGSYDYTLKIDSGTHLHTVMHGRFKIID